MVRPIKNLAPLRPSERQKTRKFYCIISWRPISEIYVYILVVYVYCFLLPGREYENLVSKRSSSSHIFFNYYANCAVHSSDKTSRRFYGEKITFVTKELEKDVKNVGNFLHIAKIPGKLSKPLEMMAAVSEQCPPTNFPTVGKRRRKKTSLTT